MIRQVEKAALYLPIFVERGLFSVGDGFGIELPKYFRKVAAVAEAEEKMTIEQSHCLA
jgi:hypothetical protein